MDIKALIAKNPDYETLLRNILDTEEKGMYDKDFGWQITDVPGLSGGHLMALMAAGVVEYGYRSSNYKHYRTAVAPDELRAALDELRPPEPAHVEVPGPTPEDIAAFQAILAEHDALDYWWPRVNPRVVGMERERKAALIVTASCPTDREDGLKRRVSVLFHGPPGSSKSAIGDWLAFTIPGAEMAQPSSSGAGLLLNATTGTLGPLLTAHGHVLVVDELDKFNRAEQNAFLQSLGTGRCKLDKGAFHEWYPSMLRAVATANDVSRIPRPLVDRFDFVLYVAVADRAEEMTITDALYDDWVQGREEYGGERLVKYLAWIRDYEPAIGRAVLDAIKAMKNMYIELAEKDPDVRAKEGLFKIAYTIARLNRRELRADDYIRAIDLADPDFNGTKKKALKALAAQVGKKQE